MFFTLLPAIYFAQVKGKVTDDNGNALAGVSIKSLNSSNGTSSDIDGNFTINAKDGDLLEFTMIGMLTQSQAAKNGMTVMMASTSKSIEEVVVIGYGTRKRIDNTTSVTSIKSEDVNKRKVLNATQAIQGKVAGAVIITSDVPGSQPTITIRGLASATGNSNPLFVVDGIPVGSISNINSSDIETYEVLKDASALAIYGNRAAGGVILITTKKAKTEQNVVEVDSYMGIRTPLKTVKMAGSNRYAYYTNTALGEISFSQDQPVNTNWFDEITRTGIYTNTNVSLSGNSKSINYLFSAGLYNEDAILNGLDYKRLVLRNNNEYKISSKLKLTQNFNISFTNSNPKPLSAFTTAYKQSPIVPVRFANGQYGVPFVGSNGFASTSGSSFNNVGNPVAQLDFFNEKQKNYNILGGLTLDYKIYKDLKFVSQVGVEYNNWKQYNFTDSRNIWLAADPTRVESGYPSTDPINLLTKSRSDYFNWNATNYLTYNKIFADSHDVELTVGTETVVTGSNEFLSATRRNVPSQSDYWALNFATSNESDQITNTISNENRLVSYFGRLQYKLNNKYLVTATLRRDGSSKFQDGQKWGNFPSFGLGWIISKESFLADSKFINLLKLRGGWGKLGNQNVALNQQGFVTNLNYYLGGSILNSGTSVNSVKDPSLSWEIIEESTVGLDFGFLNNRLTGSFDLYDKRTTNAILNVLPYITSGTTVASPAHIGEISNKGYEVVLSWKDKINDNWSYFINANYSNNTNKLESLLRPDSVAELQGGGLGNGQYTKLLNKNSVGLPLGSFNLYEYAGIGESGEMLYYTAEGNAVPQSQLQDKDRKFMGSVIPKSIYGISLGVTYKRVDLTVDAYGTAGSKVYNGKKAQRFSGENVEYDLATDFWTPNNTNASNPAPFNQVPVASSYYLESGDFLRINNITLGYNLPIKSKLVQSARVYANAINPFIFQKFSGFTPELNNDGNPYGMQGVELDAYPSLRSIVFGVNLKF